MTSEFQVLPLPSR
uniref:Uncharacterized protein n=1 Tax=Rhizophora mucronata TaxID=61149 RepID=A0A2P2Q6E2_RHIMU